MKLPNADRAVISEANLRDYLLNEGHPDNRGKARVLRALGYTQANWRRLEQDLREQHVEQDGRSGNPSKYGPTHRIAATLRGPEGTATMISIWILRSGEDSPALVTLYPES